MLKLCGLFLICGISVYGGMALTVSERKRVAQLRGFLSVFTRAQTETERMRLPLAEILSGCTEESLSKNGFLPLLRKKMAETPLCGQAFAKAIREAGDTGMLILDTEDSKALISYVSPLGTEDGETTLRRLAYATETLRKRVADAERGLSDTVRIIRTLSVSVGVLAVILFI